jgi:predicted amidohydrolase
MNAARTWLVMLVMPVAIPMVADVKAEGLLDEGWTTHAARDELRPEFNYQSSGGHDGKDALVISSKLEGLHGWFAKTFRVTGGHHYAFHAARNATNVTVPRRGVVARIVWSDDEGNQVLADPPPGDNRENREGYPPLAYAEHPRDVSASADHWVTLAGTYLAPSRATQATVELHLIGDTAASRVVWSDVDWKEVPAPTPRSVRLATVHFRPSGGETPMDNCRMYEPLLADAAQQQADLVVLGETITYVGLSKKPHEVAEPIPGPSTDYFATLAKRHDFHIVVGLYERDRHLVYNVAVLIGPDGQIAGKYRKVCLPRDEIANGVTPGNEYPVFDTRLGRIGMMVCYDGFFPEVARELANRGAEVIAWPVWGCNPLLAAARACENHIYLVSSTYTDAAADWTKSAVYGHDGQPIGLAKQWGSVVVTEVDLNQRHFWRNNLGDFKSENFRHRPAVTPEASLYRDGQRKALIFETPGHVSRTSSPSASR